MLRARRHSTSETIPSPPKHEQNIRRVPSARRIGLNGVDSQDKPSTLSPFSHDGVGARNGISGSQERSSFNHNHLDLEDFGSQYEARSESAEYFRKTSGLSVMQKSSGSSSKQKKKRFPSLKKSIMPRGKHGNDGNLERPFATTRSVPEDDSTIGSPRAVALSPMTELKIDSKLVSRIKKKGKRTSAMRALKNKMLTRKGKPHGKRQSKEPDDDEDSGFVDYEGTLTTSSDEEGEADDHVSDMVNGIDISGSDVHSRRNFDDESSDYSRAYGESELDSMDFGLSSSPRKPVINSFGTVRNRANVIDAETRPQRRRRSSVDHSTSEHVKEMRSYTEEDDLHESIGDESTTRDGDAMTNSAQGTTPSLAGTERARMQSHLRRKLQEWNIPKTEWKLPKTEDHESIQSDDIDNLDPHAIAKRMRKLEEKDVELRERAEKIISGISKLRGQTQGKLNELSKKIRNVELRMDVFENVVSQKEKHMKQCYQNYKQDMSNEIRENVDRHLKRREVDYYTLIENIQQGMSQLSAPNLEGNSLVDAILHRGFSLVISGAGTIAHIVSLTIGLISYPVMLLFSLLGLKRSTDTNMSHSSSTKKESGKFSFSSNVGSGSARSRSGSSANARLRRQSSGSRRGATSPPREREMRARINSYDAVGGFDSDTSL